MRRSSLLILLLFAFSHGVAGPMSSLLGDENLSGNSTVSDPYLVFVAEESAHLRCGPSGEYYRTDPLRHGQELEVYVETADGWLGVRPTDDSFCWIPADTVKLLNLRDADSQGNIRSTSGGGKAVEAEVIENKTVAWIGTNLGRARRYRWQVQLGESEIVTVLGSSERDGPDGPQTWYRIVPPSGEFRWIHRDQTVTTAEELIATLRNEADSESLEFLPGGPSVITEPNDSTSSPMKAPRESTANTSRSVLLQVSNDRVWEDSANREAQRTRSREALSEDRRSVDKNDLELDEIERRMEARQDRLASGYGNDESVDRNGLPSHNAGRAGHQPQSFSQRITSGLSALMRGRNASQDELRPISPLEPMEKLEEIAQSSRRVPDLVPIGSGVRNAKVAASLGPAPEDRVAKSLPASSNADASEPSAVVTELTAAPKAIAKTVEATDQPGLRSNESQIAFLSTPRMVTPANVPITPATSVADSSLHRSSLPGATSLESRASLGSPTVLLSSVKTRTIDAAQLESVRRSVANSTPESLPNELSKLMARGASAPEIALVAEAAQQMGNRGLATRARDYQLLSRRRDGDTIVARSAQSPSLAMTQALPTPSIARQESPIHNGFAQASVSQSEFPNGTISPAGRDFEEKYQLTPGKFVPREQIAKTSFSPMIPAPKSSTPPPSTDAKTTQGKLVEVYSADPSRPPYAITDAGGRTIAYVTPAPGVEVKQHLGSEVRLVGESGYLQGLDTPHVLATSAERLFR